MVESRSSEPLSTANGSYVNYESAVNPQYYDKVMGKEKETERFGIPVVHRKLGLSTPNEVITYSTWMAQELDKFVAFLNDYICQKRKKCWLNSGFNQYLEDLKNENELEQEKFLKEVSDPEFLKTIQNIIDIFDKFYDTGYCGFEEIKSIRPVLRDLQDKLKFYNKSKVKEIIIQILSVDQTITDYLKSCEPKQE